MTGVLILCWLATVARWVLTRRQVATAWRLLLSATLTMVAVGFTFTWLDARYPTTTPPRIFALLFHLSITAAALTLQLYVAMAFAQLTRRRAVALIGLWAAQCAALWLTWPHWAQDPGTSIDTQFLPGALHHHLIFWGYFGVSVLFCGVFAAYAAYRGRRDDVMASVSLALITLGCGLIVAALAARVVAARNGELDSSAAQLIALARSMDGCAVVSLTVGTVSLHILPLVRRRHAESAELRDLHLLWQHVRTAVPDVALPLSEPGRRDQSLLLHRARIEILDGLHELSVPVTTGGDPRSLAAALHQPAIRGCETLFVPAAQLLPHGHDPAQELTALRELARAFTQARP